MRRFSPFGGGPFSPTLGRKVPLRRAFMGVPQDLPPTCGPNERLVIKVENLEEKWVCEPVDPAAPPPAGGPPPAPACTVPAGYEPLPGGGASVDHAVYACPLPDGTYDIINVRSFAPVLQGVSRECVDLFGDVTILSVEDAICTGTPPESGVTGACQLPAGDTYIMCPPSNGITVDYYLDARTASYGPNFTTQSPECKDSPNVIKVAANSPYCGGSNVSGPGNGYPELVACHKRPGMTQEETIVDIYSADRSLLNSDVLLKDIVTLYPGKRYIYITGMFCSELPDFGQAPVVAPAPAPAPEPPVEMAPFPAPAPTPAPAPAPGPAPQPTPGAIVVIMPPPMARPSPCDAGSWLRQRPAPALGTPRRVPLRRGPF